MKVITQTQHVSVTGEDEFRAKQRFERYIPFLMILTALVIFAWLIYFVYHLSNYWANDEYLFMRQAIELRQHFRILLPGDPLYVTWAQAHLWMLLGLINWFSVPNAFTIMHGINAVFIVSAAIPVYLVTCRLGVSRYAAWAAATLSITVPWMVFSGTLLEESVSYMVVAWTTLFIQRSVARPVWKNDLIALFACIVATFVRPQLIIFIPILVFTALLYEPLYLLNQSCAVSLRWFLPTAIRLTWRAHSFLLVICTAGALALAGIFLLLNVDNVGYTNIFSNQLLAPSNIYYGLKSLVANAWAIGLIPLLLTVAWVLSTFWRPRSKDAFGFALLVTAILVGFVYEIGLSTAEWHNEPIHERYFIYAMPWMYIATVMLLVENNRRRWSLWCGLVVVMLLIGLIPIAGQPPSVLNPGLSVYRLIELRLSLLTAHLPFSSLTPVSGALVLMSSFTICLHFASRSSVVSRGVAIWTVVSLLCLNATILVYLTTKIGQSQAGAAPEWKNQRNWIDQNVPAGKEVVGILDTVGGDAWVTQVMGWNKTFGGNYTIETVAGDWFGYPVNKAHFNIEQGTLVGPSAAKYAVVSRLDSLFHFTSAPLAAATPDMLLYKVKFPEPVDWAISMPKNSGYVEGVPATLRIYRRAFRSSRKISVAVGLTSYFASERKPIKVGIDGDMHPSRSVRLPLQVSSGDIGGIARLSVKRPRANFAEVKFKVVSSDPGVFRFSSVKINK